MINNCMKHIIYKTYNRVNGKYYIGKHSQKNGEFDGYLGSGRNIRRAVEKYGKENFVRETIAEFDTEEECFLAEAAVIGDLWYKDPMCYNENSGGFGQGKGFKHSQDTIDIMIEKRTGQKRTAETKKKMSQSQMGEGNGFYGREHTDEAKRLIGEASKTRVGEKNSMFKGYYITPWGKFSTIKEAATDMVSSSSIHQWCKHNHKTVNNIAISRSKYLTKDDYGKTFKELGFWFEEEK